VVDGAGALVNREEFTPYGDTSFGSFARKRYRFTGKERDEESGLNYQGARYYAPWLARWTSCDPAGIADGPNLYTYVRNNPMRLVDPTGMQGEDDNMSHKPCECSRAPAKPEKNASSAKPPNYTPVPKHKEKPPAPTSPFTQKTLTSQFSLRTDASGPSPLDFYKSSPSSKKNSGPAPPAIAEPLPATTRAPAASGGVTSGDGADVLNIAGGGLSVKTLDIELQEMFGGLNPAWSASAEAERLAGLKSGLKAAGALANVVGVVLTAEDQREKTLTKTSVGTGVDVALAGGASLAIGIFLPVPAALDAGLGWLTGGYNGMAAVQWTIRHTVANVEEEFLPGDPNFYIEHYLLSGPEPEPLNAMY
jgi:RHS repeat-associated protein